MLVAVDDDDAVNKCDGGREEAHRRAGIAQHQRPRRLLQPAAAADDEARLVRLVDAHAHLPQSGGHERGVLALERAGQMAPAASEGGEQQRAIGDGFRARRHDAADQRPLRRHNGQRFELAVHAGCDGMG
jgi:hypothetical protein